MRIRRLVKRGMSALGVDIRRAGQANDISASLSALMRNSFAAPSDQQAAQRLIAGVNQFLQVGVSPHGQLLQDCLALGGGSTPKFFVEVGAGHPTILSNVAALIDAFGWKGIRVDPNPEFAALHRVTEREGVVFVEAAIGKADYDEMTLVMAGELSTRVDLAGSDVHAAERRRAIKSGLVQQVHVRRLDSLLREIGAPKHLGYLSIDTEGSELEVLETFPFESVTAEVITVEHNFRSKDSDSVDQLLGSRGFVRVLRFMSAWDAWYLHHSVLETTSPDFS